MPRKPRSIERKVKIFVEGHSEENYIKELKKVKNVSVIETPVNLKGGGYSTFISALKTHSFDGYIATFLVLDMDRYSKDKGEVIKFKELITLCNRENKNKNACFVIASNDNIETFFAMHFPDFSSSTKNTKDFLKSKVSNYDKNDSNIYNKLNKDGNGYSIALEKQKQINKSSVVNDYDLEQSAMYGIKNNKVVFCEDNLTVKHSNMFDLFHILQIN